MIVKKKVLLIKSNENFDSNYIDIESLSTDEILSRISTESIKFDSEIAKFKELQNLGFLLERGVNKELVKAIETISPGCITSKVSLESFTDNFSYTNHEVAVEGLLDVISSIFKMIIQNWKYIVPLIIAFFTIFKNPSKWNSGGGSGGGGSSSSSSGSSKSEPLTDEQVYDYINKTAFQIAEKERKNYTQKPNQLFSEKSSLTDEWLKNKIKTEHNTMLDFNLVKNPTLYFEMDGTKVKSLKPLDDLSVIIIDIMDRILDDYNQVMETIDRSIKSNTNVLMKDRLEILSDALKLINDRFFDTTNYNGLIQINQQVRSISGLAKLLNISDDKLSGYYSGEEAYNSYNLNNVAVNIPNNEFWNIKFNPDTPIKTNLLTHDKSIIVDINKFKWDINRVPEIHHFKNQWGHLLNKKIDNYNKKIKSSVNTLEHTIVNTNIFSKELQSEKDKVTQLLTKERSLQIRKDYGFKDNDNLNIEYPNKSGNYYDAIKIISSAINISSKLTLTPTQVLLGQLNDIKLVISHVAVLSALKQLYYSKLKLDDMDNLFNK